MTKSNNPLFSFRAAGRLGKALSFRRVRRGSVAEKTPTHPDAKSPAQLAWRVMYQKCTDLWHTLSAAEQQTWESQARRKQMTGYSYYMSLCLRPNPGIYLPLAGGTMQGEIKMASNPLSGRKLYGARAYLNATQAIQPSTTTVITLDTENYDYQGEFDISTYKYTATQAGPHLVSCLVTYVHLPDQSSGFSLIMKNGALYVSPSKDCSRPVTGYVSPLATDVVDLAIGDFLQLGAWHNAPGVINLFNLTDRTFLTVFYLG